MGNFEESRSARVLVALFGVAVTGFCAWLLVVWAPSLVVDPDSRAVDESFASPTATEPTDATEPTEDPGAVARAGLVVLGDTFTTGTAGKTPRDDAWPEQVCATVRCSYDASFAESGSGFVARGVGGTRFGDRVDAVVAARPSVVVVAGGAYDKGAPSDVLEQRITDVLDRLRTGLPKSRVVVLSPFWRTGPIPPEIRDLRDQVQQLATTAGVDYVDVSELFDGAGNELVTDDGLPTPDGQAKIAATVLPTLEANVEQAEGYPGR